MKLSLRRSPVGLAVTPGDLLPGQDFEAVITSGEQLDDVSAATLDLGYVNTYRYHWAGRRDAALAYDDTSIANIAQVGTSYGSERETEDWVSVLKQDLPLINGALEAGERRVAFRVPSWAPGSSSALVGWAVRIEVARPRGRDANAEAEFVVRVPEPAEPPAELALERVAGDSCDIDIKLAQPCWMAGETVRGTVVITPRSAVPEADVAVFLQRRRVSHPLERTPANDYELDGDIVTVQKHLALQDSVSASLDFAVPLPADAAPTAQAVHGSLDWFVVVRIFYKGFSSHAPERVRRELVVFNAR